MRRSILVLLIALGLSSSANAQSPAWKFQWKKDQVLQYRVDHQTTVTEIVGGSKVETAAKLNLVKRWQVVDVDTRGVATVHMSLAALRNEQVRPSGEVLLFDSANLDKSTPELKEAMAKFVGQTLAVLRVDAAGNVIEVKQGNPAQYESELPFMLVLPSVAPQPGQAWSRPFKLSAPNKAQFDAVQRFVCKAVADNTATLTVGTTLKSQPASIADQAPLLQKQAEGEIVFDVAQGQVRSITMSIDRTLPNHQGEGSSYRLASTYKEELVPQ